jgi:hypothetical protein
MKDSKKFIKPGTQTSIPVEKITREEIMLLILSLKLEHPYHPSIRGLQNLMDSL